MLADKPVHKSLLTITIGAGEVGSVIAYSLIMDSVASEILVVDPQEAVRDAQIQDLSDTTFHGDTTIRIRAGTPKEAGQCDVVVVTAGAKQKEGESRTDLIGKNLDILKSVIDGMKPFGKDTVLLLVTNPVDVLTQFAQEFSDLPKDQVIGSGTFLDSARLRGMLAEKAGVSSYIIGVAHTSRGTPINRIAGRSKLRQRIRARRARRIAIRSLVHCIHWLNTDQPKVTRPRL